MLGFLNCFARMFLRDSLKPQETTQQIQHSKHLIVFKFHPFNYIQEHSIHTETSKLRLVLKSFEAGVSQTRLHLALALVSLKIYRSNNKFTIYLHTNIATLHEKLHSLAVK